MDLTDVLAGEPIAPFASNLTVKTVGPTAVTVVVKVDVIAVEVSPGLPPNSIKYERKRAHGISFQKPGLPEFVTAQSAPGLESLLGSVPTHCEKDASEL
jgi:hypothetical protein